MYRELICIEAADVGSQFLAARRGWSRHGSDEYNDVKGFRVDVVATNCLLVSNSPKRTVAGGDRR